MKTAIQNLYSEFFSWKQNAPQYFLLFTLAHANENAHTRVLKSLLQYTDALGNMPFLQSFQTDVVGVGSTQRISNVIITDQQSATGIKTNGKGMIDLFVRYEQDGKDYTVIIENKIHNAADTKDQLNRYVYDNVDHGNLDLDAWKNSGQFDNQYIYVVYLTRDGQKQPSPYSLSEMTANALGDHLVQASYTDDILRWLYTILEQCPYQKDGILIAGVRQYIAHLEDQLGLCVRVWKDYSDIRSSFAGISDLELWNELNKLTVKGDYADEFSSEMKAFAREIFGQDVSNGWTLHVTPSFMCLYPNYWKDAEPHKVSIPSLTFMCSMSQFLKGKGSKCTWNLELTHLPKDLATSTAFPAVLYRKLNQVFTCRKGLSNHGRNATYLINAKVQMDFDINDASQRKEYFKQLIDVLKPYTDKVTI